jgi:hypothetical protein
MAIFKGAQCILHGSQLLLALHTAKLLGDDEIYKLEDMLADLIMSREREF